MSKYIHKSHNVSVLLYHIVCPAKYRKAVFSHEVDEELKTICLEIAERFDIDFIEIGVEKDHVHFLVQSVPTYSPKKVIQTIKSITANCPRNIQTPTPSEEISLGRGVLEQRLFCQHCW